MAKSLRDWSTPLIIGGFTLMGVTGVLMFFHLETQQNKALHEWGGLVFVTIAFAHIFSHFRSFRLHFRDPVKLGLIGLFVVVLSLSFLNIFNPEQAGGGGPRALLNRLSALPVRNLSLAAGKNETEITQILKDAGVRSVQLDQSLDEMIRGQQAEKFRVLGAIFQESAAEKE
ncbi:MAG: DUF4405 domain-containing protein [Alphaproteobacteria bacterium]|nr:DUF4405 domain-containing protein [Alphaproteobacteria bacterium]